MLYVVVYISHFVFINYLSQGELEHRRLKRFYVRTNKGRKFERQISRHQRRERLLRTIAHQVEQSAVPQTEGLIIPATECEPLAATAPEQHHHIANGKLFKLNLFRMVDENEGDRALKVCSFINRLYHTILIMLRTLYLIYKIIFSSGCSDTSLTATYTRTKTTTALKLSMKLCIDTKLSASTTRLMIYDEPKIRSTHVPIPTSCFSLVKMTKAAHIRTATLGL